MATKPIDLDIGSPKSCSNTQPLKKKQGEAASYELMLVNMVFLQKDFKTISALGSGLLTQADLDLLSNELVTSFTNGSVQVSDSVA